ncbi:MAG: hypothetical protein JRJ85_21370 [Deltaproteobacteria bacterium]|nr:hypothetical protein [Deltaproteobacteria bacterium]
MGWQSLENQHKLIQIMDYLISYKEDVTVKIPGEDTTFTTRLLNVKLTDDLTDASQNIDIIIETLDPDVGNDLILSSPVIDLEFEVNQNRCRCRTRYLGSYEQPHHRLIIKLPGSIEIQEKRKEKRYVYDLPDFVSAELRVPAASDEPKSYDLSVLDCSRHGLGVVVSEKDFDLIDLINVGDPIEDIAFYATWSLVKVNGVVKHITKVDEGQYQGCYVVGIESPELIDHCEPS